MKHEPRVYRFKSARNPHWIGVHYAWSADLGKMVRVRESTKCESYRAAMKVVEERHELAQKVAAGGLSREAALESVNRMMRMAGMPEVVESRPWEGYAADWMEMKSKGTAESSRAAYASHLNTFNSFLGPRVKWGLAKFDGLVMQKFYDGLVAEGRSPKTARNILATVGRIFRRAIAEGFCTRNPLDLVQKVHGGDVSRVREVFTREEQNKVLAYLEAEARTAQSQARREEMRDWLTMTWLGAATGRRLQDCAHAGWQHFDEVKGQGSTVKGGTLLVWTLRPRKMRRVGKVERVPIVGPAAAYLRALRKQAEGLLLCPALSGRAHLSEQYIAILKAARIKMGKVEALGDAGHGWQTKGFHSWRHTLASRLAEAGVEARRSKRITGHESDQVHEGYTHLEMATLAGDLKRAL